MSAISPMLRSKRSVWCNCCSPSRRTSERRQWLQEWRDELESDHPRFIEYEAMAWPDEEVAYDLIQDHLSGEPWVSLMQPGDTYEHPLHDPVSAMS